MLTINHNGEKIDKETNKRGIVGIKRIFAVYSCKGGVGKSTTAANLALAIKSLGYKVGVLDADIYGPSQALILNLPIEDKTKNLYEPKISYDMQVVTMASLSEEGTSMSWRGPMISFVLEKMLRDSNWNVDYLVIDMPPGTGDIQMFLANKIYIDTSVIVTTPQEVSTCL
jgi:ATP-binding protein involved in chromosome partitioning